MVVRQLPERRIAGKVRFRRCFIVNFDDRICMSLCYQRYNLPCFSCMDIKHSCTVENVLQMLPNVGRRLLLEASGHVGSSMLISAKNHNEKCRNKDNSSKKKFNV